MLTRADDYPVHQTPEPIAFAGTDRNFYDRYFFNGYSRDGTIFFAAAMSFLANIYGRWRRTGLLQTAIRAGAITVSTPCPAC